MAPSRNRRKQGKNRQDRDPWYRWFAEKLVIPVLAAAMATGGGIYGAEEQAHAHHCEPTSVTTVTSTQAPNGKVTKIISKQLTSCKKP